MCSVNTYSGVTGQSWVSHVGHRFFLGGGGKKDLYTLTTIILKLSHIRTTSRGPPTLVVSATHIGLLKLCLWHFYLWGASWGAESA